MKHRGRCGSRRRWTTVANKYLFAVFHELDVSCSAGTMLVIFHLSNPRVAFSAQRDQ